MNSIYNEDITMNHKNNNINKKGYAALSAEIVADGVEEIANNADITGDERDLILEAVGRLQDSTVTIKALREENAAIRAAFGCGDVDVVSLQASIDTYKGIADDWQRSALDATDERDRLRVLVANHEARIELLNHKINRLERCVIQNALNTSRLARMEEEETDENITFHAGRMVQNQIDHERQSDEDGIGSIINDLENGDY